MALSVEALSDQSAKLDALDDLAALRISVFREWPYLYDGDVDYERDYLSHFAKANDSVLVLALDGTLIVGAATGLPLAEDHDAFVEPFLKRGWDPQALFYYGEAILLPDYRGQGIYRQFFNERERHADRLARFSHVIFCGVVRPDSHPMRPADAQPLDPVWRHFGYEPLEDVVGQFSWKDIGDTQQTEKPMQYWAKALRRGVE